MNTMQTHQIQLSIDKTVEYKVVRYGLKAGDKVELPEMHCRRCHYTSKLRVEVVPNQCANVRGYTDSEGKKHAACHSRGWDQWPDNFNPDKCSCMECLIIWHLEQKQKLQSSESDITLAESAIVALPRRRGRPPKYKKSQP
jgi:hypothetical protein